MTFAPEELTEHLDMLYQYSLGITRDPELAADTVQETVTRALERRHQYRGDAPLSHWLTRMAHNLVIDRARRSSREIVVDEMEDRWRDSSYTVTTEQVVERASVRDELLDAMARLPFIYRSAVLLHDVYGFRVIDTADIQQISLPAAKQRLRRGRMALVSALADSDQRRDLTRGVPMDCWRARQHVSEYLNGDLDRATSNLVETHLGSCPTCPPLYAALVGVHDELGRLRDPDTVVEPGLMERIQGLIGLDR